MPATTTRPDPLLCPLCGQSNQCAMEQTKRAGSTEPAPAPCWCQAQPIAAQTLARIPSQALHRACLCPRCAALPAPSVPAATA